MKTDEIKNILKQYDINTFYDFIKYDYSQEIECQKTSEIKEKHIKLLELFNLKTKPPHRITLRIFNQINTYYAEDFAYHNTTIDPAKLINECNQLILFRQGKKIGLRDSKIGFGVRKSIDTLDPIRHFKWIYGIAPRYLSEVINILKNTVDAVKPSNDMAFFLTMIFVCIHPYNDGNGRLARLFFTWLNKRWKLNELYLNEGEDGEFLMSYDNINSTEYYTCSYFLYLCDGFNEVPYLFRDVITENEENKAFESLCIKLEKAVKNEKFIFENEKLQNLIFHFKDNGHFISHSPRFRCLKEIN